MGDFQRCIAIIGLWTCPWDRPTLGTGPLLGHAIGTSPVSGQAHFWDRPILGTDPLLGQAHSWDRPILGTGLFLGQAHPFKN
jgi:hypothetical protein